MNVFEIGVSLRPNMTDSLCLKRKLANSFIPCVVGITKAEKWGFQYMNRIYSHHA